MRFGGGSGIEYLDYFVGGWVDYLYRIVALDVLINQAADAIEFNLLRRRGDFDRGNNFGRFRVDDPDVFAVVLVRINLVVLGAIENIVDGTRNGYLPDLLERLVVQDHH